MSFPITPTEGEIYNGYKYNNNKWDYVEIPLGFDETYPANSASEIIEKFDGLKVNDGFYWINIDGNTNPVKAYCDMTTDGGGWMLVGSWTDASEWAKTSTSTGSVFGNTPMNAFSANFGNYELNKFRVMAADSIIADPLADFYYDWNTKTKWKEVWAPIESNNSAYSSPTPRQSLKKFDSAYNIKYGISVPQEYANLSDWDGSGGTGTGTAEWHKGLTTSGVSLGIYDLSKNSQGVSTIDGTIALSPSNAQHHSGQDTSYNVKIGYDDGQRLIRLGGGNSTNVYANSVFGADAETKLWFWIK